MPPWQGGGDMIESVSFSGSTWAQAPLKFEAGTPNIAGVIGLGAAIDWCAQVDWAAARAHEQELLRHATDALRAIPGLRILGEADEKVSLVSFTLQGAHPHDIATIVDHDGVAIRAGHHCAQPIMERFKVPATARASFALYNTHDEVERLAAALRRVQEMFA
jgi:cysteine desulfurase / selenocysteine lyase